MTSAKTTIVSSVRTLSASTIKEWGEVLRRYLVRRVRRPEDAEDLAQEVFELYLRKRDHADTVRDPLAYLFGIASHVAGNALKSGQRGLVTFDSDLADSHMERPDGDFGLEEELALKDEIQKAVARLPSHHMKVLMLVEGQGLSHKEAAKVMGLAPHSVTIYMSQARAALKLMLDAGQDKRSRR